MQKNSKIIMIIAIIGVGGVFGYIQYVSVTHLHVSIVDSKIVERTNEGTLYNMQLEFKNPSLMILNVGKTNFVISVEGKDLGSGTLEPSTIPALGNTIQRAPFLADNAILDKYNKNDNVPSVKLVGTTKYDFFITSINIPFTYYPTQDEASAFIHGT
ncbi:MAG: hypothetical protein ACREAD_01950 [Nitrosopumilaceae archaeon]